MYVIINVYMRLRPHLLEESSMYDIPKLCMCCMTELDANRVCPECGNAEEIIQPSPYLPLKTVIGGKYITGMEKKKNSEGITYAAYDMQRAESISLREFYPDSLAVRAQDNITVLPFNNQRARYIGCMNSFLSLWRTLEKLRSLPAMISVYDIIEQNGTVYAVYAEPERISLRDYLLQTEDGYIPWEQAKVLFAPVLETVTALNNAGIIHRGISPSSLIVGNDGTLKLTNFGILQVRSEGSVLRPELFEGYAAYEQYETPAEQGTWTDVYALASSLYRTLTGVMPLNALSRAQEDLMMFPAFFTDIIPSYVIEGIIGAMEIYPKDRIPDAAQLCSTLQIPLTAVYTPPVHPVQPAAPAAVTHRPVQQTARSQPGEAKVSVAPSVSFPAASSRDAKAPVAKAPAQPAPVKKAPPKTAPAVRAADEKATKKTTALIILLVIVLLLLLAGIALTVKGIIQQTGQLYPDIPAIAMKLNCIISSI